MRCLFALLELVAYAETIARANEHCVPSKVTSVGLFKNGLAIVKREVTLPGPGLYRLDQAPEPVHGTFWITPAAIVDAEVQMREVELKSEEAGPVSLTDDLAGKEVKLYFHSDKLQPIMGRVVGRKKPAWIEGDEASAMDEPRGYPGPGVSDDILIVETGTKRTYLRASTIAYAEVDNAEGTVKRKRPMLLLSVKEGASGPVKVEVTYLARGLSWAPSYRVDISDPKRLAIEQSAVVRNELVDLKETEFYLISGFPSVQFGHVRSPLAARTSWQRFFQQLGSRGESADNALGQVVIAQNAMAPWHGRGEGALGLNQPGEGIDLHYQSIGQRELHQGDALSLTVARAEADYERIVEWLVPDNRNEYGTNVYRDRSPGGDEDDTAWDALKFRNPFSFPMTSAPAYVAANGRFGGQRLSQWVNSGEETLLRVNKALSIRTRSAETEAQTNGLPPGRSERDVIWIGGRQYSQATVQGELSVYNHRKEQAKMVVRRRFSGDLLRADGDFKVTLREEGAWSVNKRNELTWSINLKPGEERKLVYRYLVLVAH
jgi:hypothetical protein